MQRHCRKGRIGLQQVLTGQQVHIMKDKYIMTSSLGYIESNIEQLSPVKLSTIITLFDNVDTLITQSTLGLAKEPMHVRNKLF